MIEAALVALHDHGLGERRVANRTAANAQRLADRFGGSAHALDELDRLLPDSDVVLTCVGGDEPILTRERVERSLVARRGRPLFLIDIGVPRNVDPGVHEREQFEGWMVALQAVPTIRDLRDRAESIRRGEIDRFAGRLGLTNAQADTLEQLTNSIVNKLMHEPISRLRDETDREAGLVRLEEARALFGLDRVGGADDGEDSE